MTIISQSLIAYCLFFAFSFELQRWGKQFKGRSAVLRAFIVLSGLLAMLVGIYFLVHLGLTYGWKYPLEYLPIALVSAVVLTIPAVLLKLDEMITGGVGFFLWPPAAWAMFHYLPPPS